MDSRTNGNEYMDSLYESSIHLFPLNIHSLDQNQFGEQNVHLISVYSPWNSQFRILD